LVLDAPDKCGSLRQKSLVLSMCMHIKNCGYIKPNTMVGKTGYKWKTPGISDP
jgi:hypothetical protein